MSSEVEEDVLSVDKEFHEALAIRIEGIRKKIRFKDKAKFKKGKLFKDSNYAIESVLVAISDTAQAYHNGSVAKTDEQEAVLVSGSAIGLGFTASQVELGWYDSIIKVILGRLAEIDSNHETNPDLN